MPGYVFNLDRPPEAFVFCHSIPWADNDGAGLVIVALAKSIDAFEAQLRRIVGEDGQIGDALFTFTRRLSGSYF